MCDCVCMCAPLGMVYLIGAAVAPDLMKLLNAVNQCG